MSDLLILCPDEPRAIELAGIGEKYEFRTKTALDLTVAKKVMQSRPIDLCFVQDDFDAKQLEELAELLWKKNPMAPFVVFDIDLAGHHNLIRRKYTLALKGYEFVESYEVPQDLTQRLQAIKKRKADSGLNFEVMIVEDLVGQRDIISAYVEHIGYKVREVADSGSSALELLQGTPRSFSCVITDISMPEMSGRELIKEIRADRKLAHLPIIVLTAYGTGDNLIECLRHGASGFLVKPPKKEDLKREISRAFRIFYNSENPSLVQGDEIEQLEELLDEMR